MECQTCGTPGAICDCFGSVASAMALARKSLVPPPTAPRSWRLLPLIEAQADQLVLDRRHFHAHPELSYQERATAAYIAAQIAELGDERITVTTNVDDTTGLFADLDFGSEPGPSLLLRADMDALPIQERAKTEYSSQNANVMHACGHDGHMAIMLACVRALSRQRPVPRGGRVRFLFQPAEEGGFGAKRMIAGGCLDSVDRCFGLHLWNFMPVGTVGVCAGPITANSDRCRIVVRGKGGHGSMPQGTVDAILVAAHLVVALQSIVARNFDPFEQCVITIGKLNAGYVANAIADEATLEGTVRTRSVEAKRLVKERMEAICSGVAATFGAEIEFSFVDGYPATISSEDGADLVKCAARKILNADCIVSPHPTLAGEDMSYYLKVGSSPVDLNADAAKPIPHHRPDFDIDERSLGVGASVLTQVVLDAFASYQKG